MAWKESCCVNERMKFVTRLESGERMTDLCHEFGISRKTGYKFLERYQRFGPIGLYDESRRPHTSPSAVKEEIRKVILEIKHEKPTWGPRKIKEQFLRRNPGVKAPSAAAIYTLLCRHDLVKKRRQRPAYKNQGTIIPPSEKPNDIWCGDFKGQFLLRNQKYCYPLTITDHLSRFLLGCESLENNQHQGAVIVFENVFKEYGLPLAILSDNGAPFGSVGSFGFSKLSLWWIRLGIKILRIKPGHPEENGRHERMHRTLKQETTRPAGANFLQQQERFDRFRQEYNNERPHEALQMKCPSEIYKGSDRTYPKVLSEPEYPLHDVSRVVNTAGQVCLPYLNCKFNIGRMFIGQRLGLREEEDGLWRVSFVNYDLGIFDTKDKKFNPFDYPQESEEKVSPISVS